MTIFQIFCINLNYYKNEREDGRICTLPYKKLNQICLKRPAQATLACAKSLKIDSKKQVSKKNWSWTTGRLKYAT